MLVTAGGMATATMVPRAARHSHMGRGSRKPSANTNHVPEGNGVQEEVERQEGKIFLRPQASLKPHLALQLEQLHLKPLYLNLLQSNLSQLKSLQCSSGANSSLDDACTEALAASFLPVPRLLACSLSLSEPLAAGAPGQSTLPACTWLFLGLQTLRPCAHVAFPLPSRESSAPSPAPGSTGQ